MIRRKKRGMKCVLQGMHNELIADGSAVLIGTDTIDVENSDGLPTLALGTFIKVIVYRPEGGTQVWAGNVYYSTQEKLRIQDAYDCSNQEKRKTYRVSVNCPAQLILFRKNVQEEEKLREESILVRDISAGGCLIEVPGQTNIAGKSLKLRLSLYSTVEEIRVEIKNCRKGAEGQVLYGMAFTDMNTRVEHEIDMYLLKIQQEQIRKSRNRLWRYGRG